MCLDKKSKQQCRRKIERKLEREQFLGSFNFQTFKKNWKIRSNSFFAKYLLFKKVFTSLVSQT